MTSEEYNDVLRKLGVSPGSERALAMQASKITGMGWRMSLRYARGETSVSEPVARLLLALLREKTTQER